MPNSNKQTRPFGFSNNIPLRCNLCTLCGHLWITWYPIQPCTSLTTAKMALIYAPCSIVPYSQSPAPNVLCIYSSSLLLLVTWVKLLSWNCPLRQPSPWLPCLSQTLSPPPGISTYSQPIWSPHMWYTKRTQRASSFSVLNGPIMRLKKKKIIADCPSRTHQGNKRYLGSIGIRSYTEAAFYNTSYGHSGNAHKGIGMLQVEQEQSVRLWIVFYTFDLWIKGLYSRYEPPNFDVSGWISPGIEPPQKKKKNANKQRNKVVRLNHQVKGTGVAQKILAWLSIYLFIYLFIKVKKTCMVQFQDA